MNNNHTLKIRTNDNAKLLFRNLIDNLDESGLRFFNLDEDMGELSSLSNFNWKPRFLLNFKTKSAYEIIGKDGCLVIITEDDIEWTSLQNAPEKALVRAHGLDTHFPIHIGKYKNGVAKVTWVINPDGEYYADSDGFGMSNDKEIELTGFIDYQGRPVTKFIDLNDDWKQIKALRREAELIIKEKP